MTQTPDITLGGRIRNFFRERRAKKRLAEIVRDTRNSFECERFRRNRAAQIKRRAGGGRASDRLA